jgi:hypothetical protein
MPNMATITGFLPICRFDAREPIMGEKGVPYESERSDHPNFSRQPPLV